ncbi:hypothetical protein GXI35_12830 [Escherichia coli]|nr:hypothetical protein [Escherichia coli]EFI4514734.1 hypothetical protein [Escherichia coli]EIZ0242827.1 hypothetical protein [Escherichia coli]EJZ0288569.1 hypothetical protein [Escherichia coli]EKA2428422.1 hypothetical protein [Escherichia coli]
MKQMSLIEMDGFLKGKCIPRDLKVNETNAEYLVRKFAEAEAKCAALAAENARCLFEVSRCHQTVDEMFHHKDKWFDKEWLSALWSTSKRLMENTQATDAFLAEVRAQGVEMFADHLLCPDLDDTIRDFAAQIRKGGKQ